MKELSKNNLKQIEGGCVFETIWLIAMAAIVVTATIQQILKPKLPGTEIKELPRIPYDGTVA